MEFIDIQLIAEWMQEAFSLGKNFSYTPYGDSMLPTLKNGIYTVTFAPCPTPKVHDIVFYRRPSGKYTLHRIVGKYRGDFMLCGDNEHIIEYPVSAKAIFAKVVEAKDENGNAVRFHNKQFARKLWFKKLKLIIKKTFA